jgi:hypothetical protein
VVVRVAKVGSVLFRPRHLQVRLQQLLPVADDVADRIRDGSDPVGPNETEILWPELCAREHSWTKPTEIEPGESDDYYFDFVIPKDVMAIQVYSHLANPAKEGVGWNTTSVYYVSKGGSNGQSADHEQPGTTKDTTAQESRGRGRQEVATT